MTVGVEEEYLLLDPETGHPVARSEEVRRAAGLDDVAGEDEVQPELLQAQVETATATVAFSRLRRPRVRSVEVRMLSGMTGAEQSRAFGILQGMIDSLRADDDGA